MNLAKLQQTVPATLDKINDSQKEIYTGLNRYGRSLDKVSSSPLPSSPTLPHLPSSLSLLLPPPPPPSCSPS